MALAHLTINLDAFTGDDRPPVSSYSTITLDPGADHIDAAADVIHVRTIVVSLDRQTPRDHRMPGHVVGVLRHQLPGGATTGWMWIDATGSTLTARLVTTSGPLTDTFTITR